MNMEVQAMNILHTVKHPSTKWNREPPANAQSIHKLVTESAIELPEEYLALLRYSNGGEGELAIEPGWFQLWPAEKVVEFNRGYEVEQNAPGFFGFGSNGGGEMLAFDTRKGQPWKVAMIPFIPMRTEEAIEIAGSFRVFIEAMGREYQDT
jgi:hypothetical protein